MTDHRRRQDELLDKISELVRKRDWAMATLAAWKASDPERAEFIELVMLGLR